MVKTFYNMLKRISISRTPGEFNYLDNAITEMTGQDFRRYLQSKVRKLAKEFTECKNCITPAEGGEKITREICIEADVYENLIVLSKLMDRPVNSIINEFFIAPLLRPGKV